MSHTRSVLSTSLARAALGRDAAGTNGLSLLAVAVVAAAFVLVLVVAGIALAQTVPADNQSPMFETLKVRKEGSVVFAEIAAPPMNLLGPVR